MTDGAVSSTADGVPVALVVPFDGTGSYAAPKNVACVLNLTQRTYAYMRPGSGFRGKLQNVDVSGRSQHRSFHHRQVAAAPRHGADLDPASRKRAIMPAKPRQLCRGQTKQQAGASCGCSAAAWVCGLSILHLQQEAGCCPVRTMSGSVSIVTAPS